MRILKYTCAVAVISVIAASTTLLASQRGQRRTQPQTQTTSEATGDATAVGRRLYQGVLGREADAEGLKLAAADIQQGRMSTVIDSLVASTEFRNIARTKNATQLLEQFYTGLLKRAPDAGGIQAYQAQMQRGQYAAVILALANSNEFRESLAASTTTPATPRTPTTPETPTMTRIDGALACQAKVVDAVRKAAGGRIFLTFDRMPDVSSDGKTVSGPAVDRSIDNDDRQMTYRCDGSNVTYAYADRNSPKAADARLRFPSAAVRNCQDAVRGGLVFDAASLSASDTNTEYVVGIADGGVKICTMDKQRVVSIK